MKASKLLSTVLIAGMLAGCATQKYSVYFTPGSAEISAGSKQIIKKAAGVLKRDSDAIIKVSGFTDSSGSSMLNKKLAEKRVDNVSRWLVHNGASAKRIEKSGYGEKWSNSFRNKKTEAAMRRVDIKIYE